MSEQISFETTSADDFAINPEIRCPCVLVLDVSGSMAGKPLDELNAGLRLFKEELEFDELAMKRVEVAIVTFGPTKIELPFTGAASFYPPTLQPQGDTPMGAAITQAIELVGERKKEYRANGIPFYRPWIFLITDGAPTDAWAAAAAAVREGEVSKSFAFFAIGVSGAKMEILAQIASPDRVPLSLDGLKFRELFRWLSSSLRSVSRSTPGTEAKIEAPKGWTSV
jgi:uncharacterized protein YegL